MKHLIQALRVGLCSMVLLLPCVLPSVVSAENLPELLFREVKIKGDDFAVIQASSSLEMGDYWLGYDSGDVSSLPQPEHRLASGVLKSGEAALLVGDEAVPPCDAVYVMDMPVSLAETKGIVALWHQTEPDAETISFSLVDSFTWTNTKTGIADIVRPTTAEEGLLVPTWFRDFENGSLGWRVGDLVNASEACELHTKVGTVLQTLPQAPITEAPSVIVDENEVEATPVNIDIPGENDGLVAPQITEILPNPTGTGTDSTKEFIELYNPNNAAYDLSGYVLQTGITTKHSYTFPVGTVLAAESFTSFNATVTGLSLSNTTGQATLLDRAGLVLAQTDPYANAPDGQTWAAADGEWFWSVTATEAASNIISQEVDEALTTAQVKSATTKTAVKLATASKAKTTKTTAAKTTKTTATTSAAKKTAATTSKTTNQERPVRGIHPLVLALVAAAAVGYGVYEYRHDVANAVYKFRTNRATRRSHRD